MPKQKRTYTKQQIAIIRRKTSEKSAEEYPHFRLYLKSKHPALIVSEKDKDNYNYRKTSHDKNGLHSSEKVSPNPNPADSKPMYIERKIRSDNKCRFGKKFPWKYKSVGNKKR